MDEFTLNSGNLLKNLRSNINNKQNINEINIIKNNNEYHEHPKDSNSKINMTLFDMKYKDKQKSKDKRKVPIMGQPHFEIDELFTKLKVIRKDKFDSKSVDK